MHLKTIFLIASLGPSPSSAAAEETKKPPPTTSMRLTKFSAHNAFHHCDQCQNYKDVSAVEVGLERLM